MQFRCVTRTYFTENQDKKVCKLYRLTQKKNRFIFVDSHNLDILRETSRNLKNTN